jgi:hypothetical protein
MPRAVIPARNYRKSDRATWMMSERQARNVRRYRLGFRISAYGEPQFPACRRRRARDFGPAVSQFDDVECGLRDRDSPARNQLVASSGRHCAFTHPRDLRAASVRWLPVRPKSVALIPRLDDRNRSSPWAKARSAPLRGMSATSRAHQELVSFLKSHASGG